VGFKEGGWKIQVKVVRDPETNKTYIKAMLLKKFALSAFRRANFLKRRLGIRSYATLFDLAMRDLCELRGIKIPYRERNEAPIETFFLMANPRLLVQNVADISQNVAKATICPKCNGQNVEKIETLAQQAIGELPKAIDNNDNKNEVKG